MNKEQRKHERELQYHYYYELAKKEPYVNLDGMPYKYARFVHATLAEYDPVNYNRFGMTEQLEEVIIAYSEEMSQEISTQLNKISANITGNIQEDMQDRNHTLLELEEIVKQEFVERIKNDKYIFQEATQKSVDQIF